MHTTSADISFRSVYSFNCPDYRGKEREREGEGERERGRGRGRGRGRYE
jgi:hypothetical protein